MARRVDRSSTMESGSIGRYTRIGIVVTTGEVIKTLVRAKLAVSDPVNWIWEHVEETENVVGDVETQVVPEESVATVGEGYSVTPSTVKPALNAPLSDATLTSSPTPLETIPNTATGLLEMHVTLATPEGYDATRPVAGIMKRFENDALSRGCKPATRSICDASMTTCAVPAPVTVNCAVNSNWSRCSPLTTCDAEPWFCRVDVGTVEMEPSVALNEMDAEYSELSLTTSPDS